MKQIKNIIIITLLLINGGGILNAQIILRNENFDHLIAGLPLAVQDTTGYWSVFNDTTGSIHDPLISDEVSTSTPNALNIYQSGALYDLAKQTTGRFELNFDIYVKPSKMGFFTILQDYPTTESNTGIEVYFDNQATGQPKTGYLYANSQSFPFSYTQGEWISVRLIIDLDDDFGTIYINDEEVAYYRWDGGASGLTGLSSIEFLQFFAWSKLGAHSDFFVDNIEFIELSEIVVAPLDMMATVSDNNVELTWSEPVAYDAVSYILYRNGVVMDTIYNETSYADTSLYPSAYTYSVRANTASNGYSHRSEERAVTIDGGVTRQNTLFEIFTGTWCYYCPGASLAADDLIANGDNAALIEYHSGDQFEHDHGLWRKIKYYDVHSFPTAFIDGGHELSWGSETESIYPIYKPLHDLVKVKPALHRIALDASKNSDNSYTVKVSVEEAYKYFNDLKLQVALTESHIEEEWQGLSELNFVLLKMYPHGRGTALDFSTNNTFVKTFEIELPETAVAGNCEIVVFVQDDETQEVSQTVKLNLTDPSVGIYSDFKSSINLFPNPTNSDVLISGAETNNIQVIEIYSTSGVLMNSVNNVQVENKISLEAYNNGIYLIKIIYSNATSEFHKVIKN